MTPPPFSYSPGAATAVCAGRLAALIELEPGHELVAGVHGVLSGPQPGLDDVLDVLVSLGLRTVGRFALAEASDAGVRVVVRGGWTAEVAGTVVRGEGLWVDRFLDGAVSVVLAGPDAGAATLPLAGGVVLASRVSLDAAPPAEPAATVAEPVEAPPPEPAAQTPAEPAETMAEPVEAPDEASVHDFDHLFGATQIPDPEDAAAGAEPAGATMASPFTAPLPGWGGGVDKLRERPDQAVEPADPLTGPGSGFISALPWAAAGLPTPEQTPVPTATPAPPLTQTPASHAAPELTVERSQLGGPAAAMVVAARCAAGHLSPAHAGTCRVCGTPLPAQQPFEVPRPSLGVLRLSDGDTVTLDRGAILGRSPRLPQGWTGEQPNLVRIDDPDRDVSGQHLEVRLDYWHVLVRDLGSTNGTEVTLPGAAPVALRPNDPMAIEPGTRVVLAGVFHFTFEVTG